MQRFRSIIQAAQAATRPTATPQNTWQNPAAVLYKAKDLRFEHHELPSEVPRGYVRVGIRALGICASDLHYLHEVGVKFSPLHDTN